MSETIHLQVDAETARAFQIASPEERQKLGVLLSIWLQQSGLTTVRNKNKMLLEEKQASPAQESER